VNLGSPDSPSVPDVRRYLNEFLMDGRVIDAPWLVRRFVVGTILINRPQATAHAYEKVWTKEGSPLIVTSRHVQEKLQALIQSPVALAMRYQNPSIKSAVKNLAAQGATEVLLIPLFPHCAMASYETAVVRVREVMTKCAPQIKLKKNLIICCSAFTAFPNGTLKNRIRPAVIVWPRRIVARRRARRTRHVTARNVSKRPRSLWSRRACRRENGRCPFNRGWAKTSG
jgi:hypothetical protein